jgi:adenine-specific DNA-methyltransferase
VVPIYIQVKIHPQACTDDLMSQPKSKPGDRTLSLFNEFNGIDDFDKKIDFYHHAQHWSNRMILGDSLLVMTSLAEKEGLRGKVQTIYFDPPYGIKFGSNWQVSTRKRDVKDGKIEDATRQPEQIRAFRDTWRLGIHSYLAYLRDRLVAARELLTDTGSIFVQIGDENVHLVRNILDEVLGQENFVSLISCAKTTTTTGRFLPGTNDYLLWYAKDIARTKYRPIYLEKEFGSAGASNYNRLELEDGTRRSMTNTEKGNFSQVPRGSRLYRVDNLTSPRVREARTGYYPIEFDGHTFLPQAGEWKTHKEGMERLRIARRLAATGTGLYYVRFMDDFPAYPINNSWVDTVVAGFASEKLYVVQTNPKIIERVTLMTTDPGDLVLDPTCGSGTAAYVAEQWRRRWITIDTSRVALSLARSRLMAAKYPYYLLADSPDGIKKEAELTGQKPPPHETHNDVRKGFVYKRVPHVTLKSIANNAEIKKSLTRVQIDQAIARHADFETLYDKPYEDPKCVRVSGPFTVESLSPHRVLAANEETPRTEVEAASESTIDFATMVLDKLKKAGVQNTVKNERLKFDTLDPFAGTWLHATGSSTGADGQAIRVAVSIGPQHGAVGPQQVKEAAKEAVLGIGFDILIVWGFAFDPHVAEEAKRYGKLTVLPARMNPDLLIGTGNEALLKNTGAGNLFMVFGEPDVEVKKKGNELTVEIKGVDVYDPTTGQIRNASTDDIACWFIDTDYNGESFFVRQAYFTGAHEPYEKLKRALKAEIDEAAWSSL